MFLVALFAILLIPDNQKNEKTNKINAIVINSSNNSLTVKDSSNIIYTFSVEKRNYKAGDNLIIEYTGLLNKNTEKQDNELVNISPVSQDEEEQVPSSTDELFSQFNILASKKLSEMTLDEKIGQILLVHYSKENLKEAISTYKVGGFLFFEKDFKEKTTSEVINMINELQTLSNISLLTAVDEEGGEVVRISSNSNLIEKPFSSPRQLYSEGGFSLISSDTKTKSSLLENLGINVNLAPVVDVSTAATDYIYNRTIGEDTEITSKYAQTVIEASKDKSVSYVLKHFPGYSNNKDTHEGPVLDNRTYEDIESNDLPPFEAGISSGAEAVLISHNTIQSIDPDNPASLSASIHNLLRNKLNFTGIIISDDLSMKAVSSIENPSVKALLAGNDIIITNDYKKSFNDIKRAIENNTISENLIDSIVHRIISWKYYKGLMYDKTK